MTFLTFSDTFFGIYLERETGRRDFCVLGFGLGVGATYAVGIRGGGKALRDCLCKIRPLISLRKFDFLHKLGFRSPYLVNH